MLAKRVVVITAVIAVVAIAIVAIVVLPNWQQREIFSPGNQMQVYFFSPSDGRLYSEGRPLPAGDHYFLVAEAVRHLSLPPNSSRLSSTWPNIEVDELIVDLQLYDRTLIATFYDTYLEMPPMTETLFRSAFALTMINLPFIDDVKMRVNGSEWVESTDTIANAPSIGPARLSNTQFILYFIDESGEGLVRKYYDAVEVDVQQRVREALELLIRSPEAEGTVSLIPPETRIRAVTPVSETASIYINLSSEFNTRFNGSTPQARLMIASIVNTVIENSRQPGTQSVRQVFFLIDSSRQEQFHGVPDFMRGFEYDGSVLMGANAYDYTEDL